ncbi:MAG: glutaredoxin 3 [Gammaproteobacteria bacterium]|nr:glutaredoxin 3 [Gammaproteobacteria bacterium]
MTQIPKEVVIYSTGSCPYCVMARQLLEKKHVRYTEVRVDQEPGRRMEMEQRSRRRSVPQIFIGETHVGGFDDMARMEHRGELDALLKCA